MAKKKDSFIEMTVPESFNSFFTPIAIILSAMMISASVLYLASKFESPEDNSENSETAEETIDDVQGAQAEAPEAVGTVETFNEHNEDICKEDGKPLVLLMSTTWCPHCEWIADTFDSWAKENSGKAAIYHWQVDTGDNTLTDKTEEEVPQEYLDIYEKFNPRQSIPTFVFGCKYSRIGNGYESEDDLGKEKSAFSKILEKIQ